VFVPECNACTQHLFTRPAVASGSRGQYRTSSAGACARDRDTSGLNESTIRKLVL